VAMLATPGFKSVAADPRCAGKLLLISLCACPDARTLTMRERALTKDAYLMSA
jgi:hypothetical protein